MDITISQIGRYTRRGFVHILCSKPGRGPGLVLDDSQVHGMRERQIVVKISEILPRCTSGRYRLMSCGRRFAFMPRYRKSPLWCLPNRHFPSIILLCFLQIDASVPIRRCHGGGRLRGSPVDRSLFLWVTFATVLVAFSVQALNRITLAIRSRRL
jgi:hypothetical protein